MPDRPCYFVTSGRRGGGKTTTLNMLFMAILGHVAAACAWSDNVEERRKAIASFLLMGVAGVVWDNIERGSQISCPHIEKACTAEWYADRLLGVSKIILASAACIWMFTGNNIGPK